MARTTAIVAYGSLLHPLELARQQGLYHRALPLRVNGYQRCFAQEPSWRSANSPARAVLRVDPAPEQSFNGLLLPLENESVLALLDNREIGYQRIKLVVNQLQHFNADTRRPWPDEIYLYRGREEKLNLKILPNPRYLSLCLVGAKKWGEDFYQDFLQNTRVGDVSLKEALASKILLNS